MLVSVFGSGINAKLCQDKLMRLVSQVDMEILSF